MMEQKKLKSAPKVIPRTIKPPGVVSIMEQIEATY